MANRGSRQPYPWEVPFAAALQRGDLVSAVAAMRKGKSGGRGPSREEVKRALTLLVEATPDPQTRVPWAARLLEQRISNTLGMGLVVEAYRDVPSEVADFVLQLAEHPEWERREDAASLLSELLLAHFDDVYSRCFGWVRHPSANVRRAVAVAVKRASRARRPEWGQRFLDLLEPLLADREEYVRKNLGPFAIGDGMLRCYPEATLERLESWAQRPDEETRWNVAMVFSAAEGAKHMGPALSILSSLAEDERRFVWRAVASAMRNLGRRQPDAVVPLLRDWLDDERRRPVAEVALRYIVGRTPG